MAGGLLLAPSYAEDIDYPAYQDRLLIKSIGVQAGVCGEEDFKVSVGTGLQVNVKSGKAFVEQTKATEESSNTFYNGVYNVLGPVEQNPYNSVEVSSVNPQIAQIILRVYDVNELKITGSTYARIEWLNGTPNAGATIAHVEAGEASSYGAAVLPTSSFRSAYVVIPKNATKSSEFYVIDERTFSNKSLELNRGQSYSEQNFTRVEAEAGAIPSLVRSASVNVAVQGETGKTLGAAVLVNTKTAGFFTIGGVSGVEPSNTIPIFTNPGQKWSLLSGGTNIRAVTAYTKIF